MAAEKSVKELEGSRVALTITIDAESVENAYTERVGKYSRELTLPGFRKGKAPLSVIERKYGDAIREEAVFELMEKTLGEVTKTLPESEAPLPFEAPVLKEDELPKKFEKNTPLTYTVEYDVTPKVVLPEYTGLTVETPIFEVTEKDIDTRIEELRERMAVVKTKDAPAEDKDIVTLSYAEVDEDGNTAGEERRSFTFTLGTGYNFFKLDKDIVGMKAGEKKTVTKSYTEEDDVPGYAGKTVNIAIELEQVKTKEYPEVDNEFAEDVKEEYKSVEDLRAGIKAEYEKTLEEVAKNIKADTLVKELCSKVDFPIPESMIRSQLESRYRSMARESGLTVEHLDMFLKQQNMDKNAFLEGYREQETLTLKSQFILDAIAKKENFPVDEAKVEEASAKNLENVPEAERDSYKDMIRDELRFQETVPFLLEKNTFKEGKKFSYYDYLSGAYIQEEEEENN